MVEALVDKAGFWGFLGGAIVGGCFGGCGLLLVGVLVVDVNFGGCGLLLLLVLVVLGDGYLVVICSVGSDLVGFGFWISVWCYNGGFRVLMEFQR